MNGMGLVMVAADSQRLQHARSVHTELLGSLNSILAAAAARSNAWHGSTAGIV
jgi:hypothetical protein